MISHAVSPLRRRMIEDMAISAANSAGRRTNDDIRQVHEFALLPDRAEPEDLRRCQLHLSNSCASSLSAVRHATRFLVACSE